MTQPPYQLLTLLRAEGPLSPATLIARLGLSQPTLFRAAKSQPNEIVALGAARNRKLAALRNIRGIGTSIPIFSVSVEGDIALIGNLLSLYPTSFAFVSDAAPSKPQLYPGLPFFLDDIRPQGFLGRAFSQKHADLRLPLRILDWNNDDILEAMASRGEDLTGNVLVGAQSFERFQTLIHSTPEIIDATEIEDSYARYAQLAIDGEPTGSSAGGEHPKFCAITRGPEGNIKRVLVKFSPIGNTFASQRWRDLLICEALALETLRNNRIAAAEGRIIEAKGRTFLETIRFDRVGLNGRKGVISLSAFQNEWTGHRENWAIASKVLEHQKKITADDAITIQKVECFGRLIANSDRHPGNLSFFWEPGASVATLTPIYDMLPMLYAPSTGGEDTGKIFTLPTYDHTLLHSWKDALFMAIQYWERVCSDSRLSGDFRKIANKNIRLLKNK
ncbi:MAG: type II toxin-antitoxin system HipA family toxin YjjJ [Bdellovibrionia bacterium]